MAANNTHRMISLLKHTALEWILIILLLLNAIFSFMISKFASFFGLKPTCLFCSRIDHLFERGKSRRSCRDFLCDSHAREVSKFGFCAKNRSWDVLKLDPMEKSEKLVSLDRILHIEMRESEEHSYVLVPTSEYCDDEVVDFEGQQGSERCGQEQIEPTQFHAIDPVTEIEQTSRRSKHLKICPVLDDIEEERIMPETPTTPNYMDNIFHVVHKRLLFERRESGTESLDGSIASDIDNLEPPTIDRLKTALKSERKALIALYAELEEERSASAIAANQTMAMITRLQEEKAAMQMEARQYQRMMDEQSEYDQEALHLLNELMMRREKEKQELKKELEVYRHKVRVYEAIERRKMAKRSSSSDEISVDSQECEDGDQNFMKDVDVVDDDDDYDEYDVKNLITLDESLVEFEEERLAILDQLKGLEEKLFIMDDEHDSFNSQHLKQLLIENGYGTNGDCEHGNVISLENDDDDEVTINHKKLAFAEEVDHVYERLQALESDREFLKHCLSSLKKGERGLDLLQEILHHLRDLRIVELRSRHIEA